MLDISIPRIERYAVILGIVGTAIALLTRGVKDAGGFMVGALISLLTISSWSKLAASLTPGAPKAGLGGSAVFLVARYLIIGGTIYGIVKVLGTTPVAMLLGLLVSFGGVVIELLQQASKK
jgi:hypothetical protein